MKSTSLLAMSAALFFWSAAGWAQNQNPSEASSFPVERMRLSIDQDGLIDVDWAGTPGHLKWNLGLWVGHAQNPLVFYDAMTGARIGSLVTHRVGGSLWAAMGLFSWAQLGFEVPLTLYQWRAPGFAGATDPLAHLSAVTLGNMRVVPKIRLLSQTAHGIWVAVVPAFTVPSGKGTDYASDRTFTFNPELMISRSFGRFRMGLDVGIVLRPATKFLNLRVDNELNGRLGMGYRLYDEDGSGVPLEFDVSLSTSTFLKQPFAAANQRSLEVKLMASYVLLKHLQLFVGGGVGLLNGWGTPDWRVFGGVRFSSQFFDEAPEKCAPVELPDNDRDGIPDAYDKCPRVFEKASEANRDGCPDDEDPDHDGVLGAADKCPLQPEVVNGFEDTDGCPDDADADRDGVPLPADKCPTLAEDTDKFEDDDGCPDPDNDKDGVPDVADQCPNVPGAIDNHGCADPDRDNDGTVDRLDNCPDEPGPPQNSGCKKRQLVVVTENEITILESVFFKTSSDVIDARSYALLDNVAAVLLAHPELSRIIVEGHTDNVGNVDANMSLSKRRAESVKAYLVRAKIDPARLDAQGFGPTKPLATNTTKEGRAKNRRVVFTISRDGSGK